MSPPPSMLHRAQQVGLVLEGAVAPLERVYALDRLRDLCEYAPEPVRRAHGHLAAVATTTPRPVAIAHCALELEGGTLLVAGAVAETSYQAVGEVVLRLRRRLDRHHARSTAG